MSGQRANQEVHGRRRHQVLRAGAFVETSAHRSGLCGLNGKPWGSLGHYVDGCFRISAKACSRAESAGLFAMEALFSNDGARRFNFASLLELSALWIAFRRSAIRFAG